MAVVRVSAVQFAFSRKANSPPSSAGAGAAVVGLRGGRRQYRSSASRPRRSFSWRCRPASSARRNGRQASSDPQWAQSASATSAAGLRRAAGRAHPARAPRCRAPGAASPGFAWQCARRCAAGPPRWLRKVSEPQLAPPVFGKHRVRHPAVKVRVAVQPRAEGLSKTAAVSRRAPPASQPVAAARPSRTA